MGMKVVTETTDRQKKDRYHLTPFDKNSVSLPSFIHLEAHFSTLQESEKQALLLRSKCIFSTGRQWKKVGLWTRDRTWWMRKRSAFRNYILYHTFFQAGQAKLFSFTTLSFSDLSVCSSCSFPPGERSINWFARSGMEPDNMKWALDPGLAFQRNQSYRID